MTQETWQTRASEFESIFFSIPFSLALEENSTSLRNVPYVICEAGDLSFIFFIIIIFFLVVVVVVVLFFRNGLSLD